jgi:hypothetical protein
MPSLRRVGVALAGAACLVGLGGAAEGFTITRATRLGNGVVVAGRGAAPEAVIVWEGVAVTGATRRGTFAFKATGVPAGCIGTLGDGVSIVGVAIGGCTVEPPGSPAAPLLVTGQTTCVDAAGALADCAGTGQDGEIRAGVVPRYASHDDGTITDLTTGLVWEKKTPANMFDAYTWPEAFEYVAALNAARFAGHDDWRLPNVRELQSLIDYGRFDPAVAPEFDDCDRGSCTVSGSYWSSTSAFSAGILAWRVNFVDGFQLVGGKTFDVRVRAVRGGR